MYCNICGGEIEQHDGYCPYCGAILGEPMIKPAVQQINEQTPIQVQYQQTADQMQFIVSQKEPEQPTPVQKTKKKKRIWIPIVIILTILLLAGAGVWFFFLRSTEQNGYSSPEKAIEAYFESYYNCDSLALSKCMIPYEVEEKMRKIYPQSYDLYEDYLKEQLRGYISSPMEMRNFEFIREVEVYPDDEARAMAKQTGELKYMESERDKDISTVQKQLSYILGDDFKFEEVKLYMVNLECFLKSENKWVAYKKVVKYDTPNVFAYKVNGKWFAARVNSDIFAIPHSKQMYEDYIKWYGE